ncbi:MAG: adhesin, partial [Proteobacteria bacterium]|nr:adhesin [Pseudomonadota bacterium]
MFTLTRAAAQQIQQAAAASAAQDLALRIAARQAADGSIEYGMGFDEAQDEDLRLLLEGVAVVIADPHQP